MAPDAEPDAGGEDASTPDVGWTEICGFDWVQADVSAVPAGKSWVVMDDAFINTWPGHTTADEPYDAYLSGPDRFSLPLRGRIGCQFLLQPGAYSVEIRRRATDELFFAGLVDVVSDTYSLLADYGHSNPGVALVPFADKSPIAENTWRVTLGNFAQDDIGGTVDFYAAPPCENPDGNADAKNASLLRADVPFGGFETFDLPMFSRHYWVLPHDMTPTGTGAKPVAIGCVCSEGGDNFVSGYGFPCQ
jgi:hypothetical protein